MPNIPSRSVTILSAPRHFHLNARLLRFGINLWPPFFGAGIRVRHIASDYSQVVTTLRLGLTNRNFVGSHFGGSLYAMTDPFFMILAHYRLGRDFAVNQKGGMIDYIAPARGTVTATLNVTDTQVADIHVKTASGAKYLPTFAADIVDRDGQLVARATHILHIRRKTPPINVTTGEPSARSAATHDPR